MAVDRVGTRVAALRNVRGWTQRGLAERAHVSYSLLTKVESGHAPATPAFIGAVARALRVDVWRVTGQPYEAASATSEAIFRPVSALRRSMLAYDIAVPLDAPARPLEAIRAAVRRVSQLRRDTNFVKLAGELPPLLDELTFVALTATTDREPAFALLAEVYYAVECLGSGIGYHDIYLQAVDRFEWAAARSGDPLLLATAKWGRAGPLMREGAYRAGLSLLESARRDLDASDDATLAVLGSLHLRASLIAARDWKPDEAWAHVDQARQLAMRVGERDDYELNFGPSNVTVYGVAVAVELENGARAIELDADREAPLQIPAERVGHHLIDLARGYQMHGDQWRAFRTLQRARRAAPQQTRHHPMTRETFLTISSTVRGSEDLTQFGSWLGIV